MVGLNNKRVKVSEDMVSIIMLLCDERIIWHARNAVIFVFEKEQILQTAEMNADLLSLLWGLNPLFLTI
jgi:hypothetical protein